jgi:hypothetical protein
MLQPVARTELIEGAARRDAKIAVRPDLRFGEGHNANGQLETCIL